MTVTPLFHFVCYHCGKAFDLPGERENGDEYNMGFLLQEAETALLGSAECLEDTCKSCMPRHHQRQQQEADFQAEKDLS